MAEVTKISWCDHTFNEWWGCTKKSDACKFCYEMGMAKRWGFDINGPGRPRRYLADGALRKPFQWDRVAAREGVRRRVFCGSMMDICDAEVPLEHHQSVYLRIVACPNLDWLLLTKRPEGFLNSEWFPAWHPHMWAGTTVEMSKYAHRLDTLRQVPASVRFVSIEPMLDDCQAIDLTGIHWVIVGGESAPKPRETKPEWVKAMRDRCIKEGVAFFFKQWTKPRCKEVQPPLIDGEEWHQFPTGGFSPEPAPVTPLASTQVIVPPPTGDCWGHIEKIIAELREGTSANG
jgi:protein gp37